MSKWTEAQEWEQDWWGTCCNVLGEEMKQLLYANRMGLDVFKFHDGKSPYNFDLGGISVVDIGGGPCSLLLKCVNFSRAKVIDPLEFPAWVLARYEAAGIEFERMRGEGLDVFGSGAISRLASWDAERHWTAPDVGGKFDLALIYNVLQHVEHPQLVIEGARAKADLIRIFEWISTPVNVGHLHTLTEGKLNEWLGGEGKVETLTGQAYCWGRCYYGVFCSRDEEGKK